MIQRLADGANLPMNPENKDYQEYLKWLSEGGVPDEEEQLPVQIVYNDDTRVRAHITTTDGMATELYRATLKAATIYDVEMRVLGVDTGSGATKKLVMTFTIKRMGGSVGLVGTPDTVVNRADAGASGWVVNPHLDGHDFVVVVTGGVGRTVDWTIRCDVDTFTPGGV